ncbi:phage integrase SAM-like domain-containing protein [Pontibacter pamirensis]|uniref:phage integrase SAM-like domain-containing protein n=1 Tax=Pontibacter pamirensis TaxID=2562824 RepID=UPI00138A5F59|nr:phage integrase SAM-like domain-containing protein [Pontibacter pamirensis]
MEINRYVRTDRVKDGYGPIRVAVHYHNKRLQLSTGEKTPYPEGWDEEKQRVKSRQPFASVINQKLDNIEKTLDFIYQVSEKNRFALDNASYKALFEQVFTSIVDSGISSTQDVFTNMMIQEAYEKHQKASVQPEAAPKPLQTFLELMALWIEEEKERIVEASGRKMSPNTIKGLNSTLKRFRAFEAHRGQLITFEGMDKYFYAEFRAYMLDVLEQGVNNFGKHVRRLKQFLTWSEEHDEDLPINPKYVRFSAPARYTGVDFLYLEELHAIKALDFESKELRTRLYYTYSNKLSEALGQEAFENYLQQVELARDLFLMCCYTALRISDAQSLNFSDLKGELIITGSQKTGNISYIPFFDDSIFEPVAIVNKYRSSGIQIFPKCPKINYHLKTVQKLASVDRIVLTTKIGRKTFATLKVYQGVPRSIVMQATGHKTETSFNRYLGVNEQELVNIFKQKSALAS